MNSIQPVNSNYMVAFGRGSAVGEDVILIYQTERYIPVKYVGFGSWERSVKYGNIRTIPGPFKVSEPKPPEE
jgi:hypothetical protein